MLTRNTAPCTQGGAKIGVAWRTPYRLATKDALHAGDNTLEVEVANLWPNRLVGDSQPGVKRTYAKTNITRSPRTRH
ncbi:glycosylhydrolase-like jelly roll fold domain-containing protein [Posidoniimonas polymericola]|uniref:glycosylhydrolase-like jelly roll fold domain-containing protein n=1 Tax=Posidoniimonas polymericola TaxID=2528002 RepID=UPI0037048902